MKPRIAVFSGGTSTIANSPPLATSNKARRKYDLPLLTDESGADIVDTLRPQRLAAPVTVYVRQHSGHPLESDAAHIYGDPDGWMDASGEFHAERTSPSDIGVYEVELLPEDGLYLLPYMARPTSGEAFEPGQPGAHIGPGDYRQTFYPDASRVVEEIDRFGVGFDGLSGQLSSRADFDFHRALPPAGYTRGLAAADRTDAGEGDIAPEQLGRDYFAYEPASANIEPPRSALACLTNVVQAAISSGDYSGGIWLEGTPTVEETSYWLGLVIDTDLPMVACAAQRPHGSVSEDGSGNLIDAVKYINSGVWADDSGSDTIGAVVIVDEMVFPARVVQKADARPGGYVATGGHGGAIGTTREPAPTLSYRPTRRHTHISEVNLSRVPTEVRGVARVNGELRQVQVQVKDSAGALVEAAIPAVTMVKHGRYLPSDPRDGAEDEPDIVARIEANLASAPLAGFVAEGLTPYGSMSFPVHRALRLAMFSGMPVVRVSRGDPGGTVLPQPDPFGDAAAGALLPRPGMLLLLGDDLTATKARILLMACLLRFGSLPPAADPEKPTAAEMEAIDAKLADYQAVFDTH